MYTIMGDPGTGKTTLAATFPKPIFIQVESGMESIPEDKRPASFPPLKGDTDLLMDQLRGLYAEEHDFKTLVIDSVTQLETEFCNKVIASDKNNPRTINQALSGYGSGYEAVAMEHLKVYKACEMLKDHRNMNIVFLAHTKIKSVDLPNVDPYMVYVPRMHEKSLQAYVHLAHLVGILREQVFVNGADTKSKIKKAGKASSGGIVLTAYKTAWVPSAKNRCGITTDIPVELGVNPLVDYIPSLKQ
jgi:hypothetical protein